MPTFRGITISLQSQYDALTIPEFPPPQFPTPTTPPRRQQPGRSPSSFSSPSPPRVSVVYVLIYSGSQFWINYTCAATDDVLTKYFYFKLFVKGRCLLSWGIGEDEHLTGRVAFALFDGDKDLNGKRVIEKRSFFFQNSDFDANNRRGGNFEIRVFRSKARKREPVKFEKFELGDSEDEQNGFNISPSGRSKKGEPRKMYIYALIDPVDTPFATFKYHCRTGPQLRELGISLPGEEDVEDIITASPSRKKNRSPVSPMGLSPPTREYAAPVRPSLDSPGRAMHPLSDAPPRMHLSPTKTRTDHRSPVETDMMSPVERDMGPQPHQDFMRGIGGLSMAETRGEDLSETFAESDWNVMRVVSPVKQREVVERSAGVSVARSLSTAVSRLRRRVGSREEHRAYF